MAKKKKLKPAIGSGTEKIKLPQNTQTANSIVVVIREFYLEHNSTPFRFLPGQEWRIDHDITYPGNAKEKIISPALLAEYENENIFQEK